MVAAIMSLGVRLRQNHLAQLGPGLGLAIIVVSWIGAFSGFAPLIPLINGSLLLQPSTSLDRWWMLSYSLALLTVALIVYVWRGQLLLLFTALALTSLIGIPIVFAGAGPAILALLWILLIASGLGHRTLSIIARDARLSIPETVTFSTAIGYGMLGLITFALAIAHLLSAIALIACLAAITALVSRDIVHLSKLVTLGVLLPVIRVWPRTDFRLPAGVLAVMSISFAGSFVWALAPSVHHDAMVYHLGVPQIYVNHGGLVEVPEEVASHWAHGAEMLYTLALALVGQPLPSLIHLSFGLLSVGMIFGLGKRIGNARVGLLAAVFFSAVPVVSWELGTAYVDLMVTLFVLGSMYCTAIWWFERHNAWLKLAGFFAGFAIGTKLNSLLFMPALAALVIFSLLMQKKVSLVGLKTLVPAVASALILSAPWFFFEWYQTGNPIFPWYNSFFKSQKWWVEEITWNNFSTFGVGHGFADLIRLPWDMAMNGSAFGEGTISGFAGLSLIGLPIAFFLTKGKARQMVMILASFVGVSILLSFGTVQYFRYWLPLAPAMALLAAINVESVLIRVTATGGAKNFLLGICIVVGVAWLIATRWTSFSYNFYIPERYPYKLALGIEDKDAFLSRALRSYEAAQYLSRLQRPDEIRVFSVAYEYRLYSGRARIYQNQGMPLNVSLASMLPGELLARALGDNGFSYILYDVARVRATPGWRNLGVINPSFLQRYARLEFARNDVYVYRLFPSGAKVQNAQGVNLLSNPSFEDMGAQTGPEGWIVFGAPSIEVSKQQSRTGAVAVEVSQDDGLYQPVVVERDALLTFSAYIRADDAEQVAWLQIWWRDESGNLVGGEIVPVPTSTTWERREMSVTVPSNIAHALAYARAAPGSRVWFDDMELLEK